MIGSISPQPSGLPHALQSSGRGADQGELTPEERAETDALKRRDREVRAHEQAHATAGGPYTGQPSFQFERGADGRFYAVSGEVKIDTSEVPGNPAATVRKMEAVKRAALAPSQPSAQDRQVAAEASQKAQDARREAREAKEAEQTAESAISDPAAPPPAGLASGYQRNAQATGAGGVPPAPSREPGAIFNFVV